MQFSLPKKINKPYFIRKDKILAEIIYQYTQNMYGILSWSDVSCLFHQHCDTAHVTDAKLLV